MKHSATILAALAFAAAGAGAQEGDLSFVPAAGTLDPNRTVQSPEPVEVILDGPDWEAPLLADPPPSRLSLGPAAGYLRVRGADRGTWFGGVQARLRLSDLLSVEGAVTFHRDEFESGDVRVTQYPVQVTGMLFPFGNLQVRPYGLAGGGWYYTRFDYSGVQAVLNEDETDRLFGVHLGAGAELALGPSTFIQADLRWIFLDEPSIDNSDLEEEEFDYGQVMLGLSFRM